jgi:hypothetical protein
MPVDQVIRPADVDRIHSRLFSLGLAMNVFVPMVLILAGGLLRAQEIVLPGNTDLGTFFWVLLAVAVSEIPAIYLVRRTLLAGRRISARTGRQTGAEQVLMQWAIITFSLALAPTVYGLVYYLLGGSLEKFVILAAITLLCFLIFKPKEEQIGSFLRESGSSESTGGA